MRWVCAWCGGTEDVGAGLQRVLLGDGRQRARLAHVERPQAQAQLQHVEHAARARAHPAPEPRPRHCRALRTTRASLALPGLQHSQRVRCGTLILSATGLLSWRASSVPSRNIGNCAEGAMPRRLRCVWHPAARFACSTSLQRCAPGWRPAYFTFLHFTCYRTC